VKAEDVRCVTDHLRPILGSAVDTWATVFVAIGTVGAVAYALFGDVVVVPRRRPKLDLRFDQTGTESEQLAVAGRQRPVQPAEEPRMEAVRDDRRDGERTEYDKEASSQLVEMLGDRRFFAVTETARQPALGAASRSRSAAEPGGRPGRRELLRRLGRCGP
jgi:hypothetical protein